MRNASGHVVIALALGSLLLGRPAQAAVQVGDSFSLNFKAADGTPISTESLKGKLLVVDFWATWCGPCMAMVPHMVEMNEKYGSKGLQIIGISLDQDRSAMLAVTKEKHMTWPEYFDGQGWDNKYAKQYGVQGIPFTALVSPEGKVLYAGHPAGGLDQAIEKAFVETPPMLVDPKVLAQAKSLLDEIESKTAAGDAKSAIKLLSKIPSSAKADAATAVRAAEVQKKLENTAESMLGEARGLADQGKYVEAVAKYKELAGALAGLPAGTKATSQLSALMSKPETRAAVAAAAKDAKANEALAAALKLQGMKKDELAYTQFLDIQRLFPGTDAAATAKEKLAVYQQDSAFMAKMSDKAFTTKANSALHMGDNYRAAGNLEMARKKYQSVVDDFPNTKFAESAQKRLAEIASQ
jgi:thiol-disulfide isomerase/thioredoxin